MRLPCGNLHAEARIKAIEKWIKTDLSINS